MNLKSYQFTPGTKFSSHSEKPDPVTTPSGEVKFSAGALKFDIQILRLIALIREIHQLRNRSEDFSFIYLVEIFRNEISEKDRSILIRIIKRIGYEKLKKTFERINMECESYLCESENLFGILKRHQFSKEIPKTEGERLNQIMQFLHITMIHINILHNSKNKSLPEEIIACKNKAFQTIEPFVNKVEEILAGIFNEDIVNREYFISYETINSNTANYKHNDHNK